MSLYGDCHEVEVTPNLELLVTFGVSFEGDCHDLYIILQQAHMQFGGDQIFLEKNSHLIRYEKVTSLE
jgi:hypothetical protein